jgi:hypothetical protein
MITTAGCSRHGPVPEDNRLEQKHHDRTEHDQTEHDQVADLQPRLHSVRERERVAKGHGCDEQDGRTDGHAHGVHGH